MTSATTMILATDVEEPQSLVNTTSSFGTGSQTWDAGYTTAGGGDPVHDESLIPGILLWLPYTAFSIVLLGLMFASFVHFHSRRGHKYRQRREQLLRHEYVQELLRQHAEAQALQQQEAAAEMTELSYEQTKMAHRTGCSEAYMYVAAERATAKNLSSAAGYTVAKQGRTVEGAMGCKYSGYARAFSADDAIVKARHTPTNGMPPSHCSFAVNDLTHDCHDLKSIQPEVNNPDVRERGRRWFTADEDVHLNRRLLRLPVMCLVASDDEESAPIISTQCFSPLCPRSCESEDMQEEIGVETSCNAIASTGLKAGKNVMRSHEFWQQEPQNETPAMLGIQISHEAPHNLLYDLSTVQNRRQQLSTKKGQLGQIQQQEHQRKELGDLHEHQEEQQQQRHQQQQKQKPHNFQRHRQIQQLHQQELSQPDLEMKPVPIQQSMRTANTASNALSPSTGDHSKHPTSSSFISITDKLSNDDHYNVTGSDHFRPNDVAALGQSERKVERTLRSRHRSFIDRLKDRVLRSAGGEEKTLRSERSGERGEGGGSGGGRWGSIVNTARRRRLMFVSNNNGSMVNIRCGPLQSLDTFTSVEIEETVGAWAPQTGSNHQMGSTAQAGHLTHDNQKLKPGSAASSCEPSEHLVKRPRIRRQEGVDYVQSVNCNTRMRGSTAGSYDRTACRMTGTSVASYDRAAYRALGVGGGSYDGAVYENDVEVWSTRSNVYKPALLMSGASGSGSPYYGSDNEVYECDNHI